MLPGGALNADHLRVVKEAKSFITSIDRAGKPIAVICKKYPAYDFAPYEQELDRIRSAVSRGDQWGAKRETGVFLQMLVTHAYGLGNDAAEELAVISNRIMPEEEFGIIYPGSEPSRKREGPYRY